MRIFLQPAYILHARPYRETSMLLDVFSEEHGRVALVAKGVRTARSKWRSMLQPFSPLFLSWQGKSELMGLHQAEPNGLPILLKGECLLSGFYLNELMMRLLQKQDPHPRLYTIYQDTLLELQGLHLQEKTLRLFEKKLLAELGYDLPLPIGLGAESSYYIFLPGQGFELTSSENSGGSAVFSGKSLQAIAGDQFDDADVLRDAKRLMRMALAPLLGRQPLQSRKLFIEIVT